MLASLLGGAWSRCRTGAAGLERTSTTCKVGIGWLRWTRGVQACELADAQPVPSRVMTFPPEQRTGQQWPASLGEARACRVAGRSGSARRLGAGTQNRVGARWRLRRPELEDPQSGERHWPRVAGPTWQPGRAASGGCRQGRCARSGGHRSRAARVAERLSVMARCWDYGRGRWSTAPTTHRPSGRTTIDPGGGPASPRGATPGASRRPGRGPRRRSPRSGPWRRRPAATRPGSGGRACARSPTPSGPPVAECEQRWTGGRQDGVQARWWTFSGLTWTAGIDSRYGRERLRPCSVASRVRPHRRHEVRRAPQKRQNRQKQPRRLFLCFCYFGGARQRVDQESRGGGSAATARVLRGLWVDAAKVAVLFE